MTEVTGHLAAADGTPLFFRRWPATGTGGGGQPLVLVHGALEHSGRYGHVGEFLSGQGYDVWALDLRGHGQSGGPPMAVRTFGDYLTDLEALLQRVSETGPRRPVLLGHSMGGLVALRHALDHPHELVALVLCAPMLQIALPVPLHLRLAAPVLSFLIPNLLLPTGLDPADVTHDPEMIRRHREDRLIRLRTTPRWFTESQQAMARARADGAALQVPVLFLVAGADRVASAGTIRAAHASVTQADKELREYPDCYHELLNETCRDQVLADIGRWLAAKAPPG